MRRFAKLGVWVAILVAGPGWAQPVRPEPVFDVELVVDREPVVAGQPLRMALVMKIDRGWHVNSDEPGDEFSLPTTVDWSLPQGWPTPDLQYPDGDLLQFEFSDTPIEVWQGTVVLTGSLVVPSDALGATDLRVRVTAQACNDTQCLPPVHVTVNHSVNVVAAGSQSTPVRQDLFGAVASEPDVSRAVGTGDDGASRLAGLSLPLLIVTVFVAGLALNLTPCVYPLIPITVGFFAQQAKQGSGGTLRLAVVYVLGMSITYSVLGVTAALTGQLFGAALQSPLVIGIIVAVVLALAASMFGLWELRVPGWAMRAAGGRTGVIGALLMGFVVGFVAAPCIGPFVLGLLTFVGQRGDPVLGFVLFFTLAIGLGVPYLVLGTFTGSVNRLPASGEWMIGVRKVFGVLLIALAVYFARSFLPDQIGSLMMASVLVAGGLYLLVIDRTGHQQALVDRFMRLVSVALVVAGLSQLPRAGDAAPEHLEWAGYDAAEVTEAINAGRPVILDFYADWCAPCRELDEKTFSDPRVAHLLSDYARFKVDETRSSPDGDEALIRYQVMGMPTVIVFENGEEKFRITGFEPPEQFLGRLR